MWHIVQNQTAHRQGSHIIHHRCFAQRLQAIVCAAELQRNKGVQTSGPILQIAQTHQVVDAMVDILDMTIQHRSIRVEAQIVRLLVHLEPLRRGTLTRAYLGTDLLVENLGSTSRNGLHARLLQQLQALLDGQARLANHIVQLHRRKGLDAHLGHNFLDAANHLGIVVQIALGVYSAHDMYLRCTTLLARADLLQNLLHRVVPRTRLALAATIGAEATLEQADIGRFEVKILVIKDLIATFAHLCLGCQASQKPQRCLLPKEFGLGGIDADTAL